MHSQWDFRLSTSAQCGQSQADGATYFLSATTAPGIMHARCARLRARGVPSTGSPPPRACSPASIQRHPSGWLRWCRASASLWLVRGGLSTARVMCADCGEPLICVSRTARACVSYLLRRKNAHDISVHSSDMPCTCGDARDGAAGPAARAAPRDDARRTGRGARGPDGGANARHPTTPTPTRTLTRTERIEPTARRATGLPPRPREGAATCAEPESTRRR